MITRFAPGVLSRQTTTCRCYGPPSSASPPTQTAGVYDRKFILSAVSAWQADMPCSSVFWMHVSKSPAFFMMRWIIPGMPKISFARVESASLKPPHVVRVYFLFV